jgi:hypothetical protein
MQLTKCGCRIKPPCRSARRCRPPSPPSPRRPRTRREASVRGYPPLRLSLRERRAAQAKPVTRRTPPRLEPAAARALRREAEQRRRRQKSRPTLAPPGSAGHDRFRNPEFVARMRAKRVLGHELRRDLMRERGLEAALDRRSAPARWSHTVDCPSAPAARARDRRSPYRLASLPKHIRRRPSTSSQ